MRGMLSSHDKRSLELVSKANVAPNDSRPRTGILSDTLHRKPYFVRPDDSIACAKASVSQCFDVSRPMPASIGIVDDSPQIRQALRSFLETNTDWEICGEAENGQAAIELVQRLNPDLLILDLSMPVMNGFDAARNIIALSPKTGIVMFTAHASDQLLEEARHVGIKAVVPKDGNGSLQLLLTELQEVSTRRAV